MTRQHQLRMSKEGFVFTAVKLAKKIRRLRLCCSCGAPIKLDPETGKPIIQYYVKCMCPNTPWINIERREKAHDCNLEKVCSYTLNRKIRMMIV